MHRCFIVCIFRIPHFTALSVCDVIAVAAVICGMTVVTWFDGSTNRRHSALLIPHFTFRIPHSAIPHFTHYCSCISIWPDLVGTVAVRIAAVGTVTCTHVTI